MDYIIIGAGPAGLQLGSLLEEAGREYVILEAGPRAGTFFRSHPRHRTLISINKRHCGTDDPELRLRMDWNSLLSDDPSLLFTARNAKYFPDADDMVRYLEEFADARGLNIRYDTTVTEVSTVDGGGFRVTDASGNVYRAPRVVVATGVSKENIAPIPGIEHAETYGTMPVDPADYTDQRVLIIGKGNSAFETADSLVAHAAVIHLAGPHAVKFAWRTHYVGHLRAVNNNFLDTYQLKSQNALLDGDVLGIEKDGDQYVVTFSFVRVNEVVKELRYDRVLSCTGFRFDSGIFAPGNRPALAINDRFPAQTSAWESTNVPGLYFAGTISQVRDFKKSTNGFIHGFRYSVRALHRILESRYHDNPWPHRPLSTDADALTDAVLDRVNRSSALWQLFGFLGDVVAVHDDGTAAYLEEVPIDYLRDGGLPPAATYFTVTLEYGADHDAVDPFDISIDRMAQSADGGALDSRYLHPVVRQYREGVVVAEHHVTENLENEWRAPNHVEPLRAFFAEALAPQPAGAR
ncbi:pyridine nucleotide-disulfide oxidoreductase [Virgisporangium aliadipatigenens]|uniref:Pyridine nucleotide-disulfide oxidoreductase n=1 Tax=Virgisporangium aliadipatigenens TaxID=741659 RepID=A0A8J3YTC6_9ACTN|nr:NAD(P)-binding domain-containing protein [Virgisporangium aliadipatigenens]GIJ49461.1 pyridine nucleotide-disulfide oxidoreductase [Virgisporangium aliadipatigenens]